MNLSRVNNCRLHSFSQLTITYKVINEKNDKFQLKLQDRKTMPMQKYINSTEQCSSRLMMVTEPASGSTGSRSTGSSRSPKRQCHWVVAVLYPTSCGGVLVFWPNTPHPLQPIGSVCLRDHIVSDSVRHQLAFSLRSKATADDHLVVSLLCDSLQDYLRWKQCFALFSRTTPPTPPAASLRTRRFASRLPSLKEEA